MERLYNPDQMPEEEVKATFVARQNVVDDIVSTIKRQPTGAGVQHAVIIAPRGMGKTTVLLMVRFAIQDSELAKQWQPVQFPEERYNIYDLADFWIEILARLLEATRDSELGSQIEKIKRQYRSNNQLQEAAIATLKDWRRKHKKRLVVLVDNFDMILGQINDEHDNARLRDVLMNDGTLTLIGAATTFFHEARAYDQPLYNFFKLYELPNLKFAEMQELLRRRAEIDEQRDFEATLVANRTRLRVLEHFTGGNPRLVLMLYRVVTQSDITEVKRGLEKLLDEVTPYYKAKVECLPPQQRKILDYIARVSCQTNEGLTPTSISAAIRMTPNQVSAQLKRLVENGFVRAANVRGRSSYFILSERLYAIWYQMRFGRSSRERMGWLVDILKSLYDIEEMGAQGGLLESRLYDHLQKGRIEEAGDTLEHWRYLLEAMKSSPGSSQIVNASTAKVQRADALIEAKQGFQLSRTNKFADALRHFDSALRLDESLHGVWAAKGIVYFELEQYQEARTHLNRALELGSDLTTLNYLLAETLVYLKDYQAAMDRFAQEPLTNLHNLGDFGRARVYMARFLKSILENKLKQAKQDWISFHRYFEKWDEDSLNKPFSDLLMTIALYGRTSFARELIDLSTIPERYFALARAIDYVKTNDDALIEKLSPEVRGVVDEIVTKLREVGNDRNKPLPRPRKRKVNAKAVVK